MNKIHRIQYNIVNKHQLLSNAYTVSEQHKGTAASMYIAHYHKVSVPYRHVQFQI